MEYRNQNPLPPLLIRIGLPKDRSCPGALSLHHPSGLVLLNHVECLGMTDPEFAADYGNPDRKTTEPFGDFPLGLYAARLSIIPPKPVTPELECDYGIHGWIVCEPSGGDALAAARRGGYGYVIVGGATPARLRAALCGVRIHDGDMYRLRQAINRSQINQNPPRGLQVEAILKKGGPK